MKNSMKMFAAMFCAAMVFAFTGCSKDTEKDIVGSWSLVSTTVTETIQGQSHTETETPEEGESSIATFNEDHTYKIVVTYRESGSFTTTGTYSLDGDKLTITLEGQEPQTGTVKIDGDDMTLTYTESYGEASVSIVRKMKRV